MRYNTSFKIGERTISGNDPTYFIADIGANHDGSLTRAIELIKLAKDAGADCAKFQHFRAKDIVSKEGFEGLKTAHQAQWVAPVYETYEQYSINPDWNGSLWATARKVGIDFMTTPYDHYHVDHVFPAVHAYKIGSGDITYHQLISHIAGKGKPVFLATGASTMEEVQWAAEVALHANPSLCLMQCNTNYTGDVGNFRYVNLRVLQSYALAWPGLPLGLSDHTSGHSSVLGAVALGARVIEKHFTDDGKRKGPDHQFALDHEEWMDMVWNTRKLEMSLGDGVKRIEDNETESVVVQRRALRFKRDMPKGSVVTEDDLEALRPCPEGRWAPYKLPSAIGKVLNMDVQRGETFRYW